MMGSGMIFLFLLLALGLWALSFTTDKQRITNYVQERGGRIVSISWAPFGKGWFGEKNDRIYEVVYYDNAGFQHFATCKTAFWSGVYWTEDRVSHSRSNWYDSLSPGNQPGNSVIGHLPKKHDNAEADELARLREENAQLRKELDKRGG
jgi:hypothetical protein